MTALRFHPRCWYRREADDPEDARDTWPALIAAVTDKDGAVTGVQRTWLDPSGVCAKRRLRCRGGRWVTCWATRFASGRPAT